MKLSKYERETVIVFNEEETVAYIWKANKPLRKKLEKSCATESGVKAVFKGEVFGQYICPKKWIRLQKTPRTTGFSDKEQA